ncbi:hypothetical protein MLD38_001142 [Melastoma candidum]|uniref:Uncharacterized protein n=1 Tax=Melastoma candidum TaxID=119954 RepID=A0ACB9SG84_9MYRT|nr:hypothetical protein MLD38_001142 [Melastoma candidum]
MATTVSPTLSLSLFSKTKTANTQSAAFPCYHVSLLPCGLSAACRRPSTVKATTVANNEPSPSSSSTAASFSNDGVNWVPVVPLSALPKGERRVIIQDGETILLLWYKDELFAIENRSPAEGAYTEGLLNAKLTQDGCIVCLTTDSTFDLRSGAIKEWYPKNPVLRALTPALRSLYVYPAKADDENIYINIGGAGKPDASAEIGSDQRESGSDRIPAAFGLRVTNRERIAEGNGDTGLHLLRIGRRVQLKESIAGLVHTPCLVKSR